MQFFESDFFDRHVEKMAGKMQKISGFFDKVKGPTLLLTLYLLTH
jgi:hypothetical protein